MHSISGISDIPILPKQYFIVSDIHLEFRKEAGSKFWKAFEGQENKVCLCAGDLTNVGREYDVAHFRALCQRFRKVIYVPGNHEYYGSDPASVQRRLSEIEEYLKPKLKVLRSGEPYTFEGQRFLGDTMWFPDRPEVHIYRRMINDGAQITGLFPWAFTQSNLFMVYMRENIRPDDIVITHHIPNDIDTSPLWKGGCTEAYFLNRDCHRYCISPGAVLPKAWIYGHTHDYHMYSVGTTRFICNPIGYSGENPEWRERQFIYEL